MGPSATASDPLVATRPILVTGCFRSGTTWVGSVLGASRSVSVISEPLHTRHRRALFEPRIPLLYPYIHSANAADYEVAYERMLAGRYTWRNIRHDIRRPTDIAVAAKDIAEFTGRRARGSRPLVKDPLALFSTPWLQGRFGFHVVILVRHPAAIMYSQQRLNWRFNFRHLVAQPNLMDDLLSPWAEQIERLANTDQVDLPEESALVWRLIYGVTDQWRDTHPEWSVVRHEDLSTTPQEEFRTLCQRVELAFCERIAQRLHSTTMSTNPTMAPSGVAHQLERNSAANVGVWKYRLTHADQMSLRRHLNGAADGWYPPLSW